MPPHPKQREIIDYIFSPSPIVKKVDLVCGRGYGKSIGDIIIATMALSRGPGEVGLFLEPDWFRIESVFLKKWQKIVPPELYSLNKGERLIRWINGARLYYRSRNVTGNKGSSDDSQLGQDTTFVIDDEAALKASRMFYINTFATIREPSPARFYLTSTTPRLGPYQDIVSGDKAKDHKLFRGTSYDNIYAPGYAEEISANMTESMIRREVFGEFVSIEGQIWTMADLTKKWPIGNLDDASFVKGNGYFLACDIGVRSAWLIIQIFGQRECIVGQYLPDGGSAKDDIRFITRKYGRPAKIIIGGDAETQSQVSGESAALVMRHVFNEMGMSTPPIVWPDGVYTDKETQMDSLSMILERRILTLSDKCIVDGNNARDFKRMIDSDEWPPANISTLFVKDKKSGGVGLEDVRDAALYFAVKQHPIKVRSL